MFMAYCGLLNSLDNNATVKITIHNRRMNLTTVRQDGWIPLQNDKLDHYRSEYNQMLTAQVSGEDAYCQDKYVTVAVSRSLTDARSTRRKQRTQTDFRTTETGGLIPYGRRNNKAAEGVCMGAANAPAG